MKPGEYRSEKMCLRKRIFWTAWSAERRAKTINEEGPKGGGEMRSYQCPNCLQWHLTRKA